MRTNMRASRTVPNDFINKCIDLNINSRELIKHTRCLLICVVHRKHNKLEVWYVRLCVNKSWNNLRREESDSNWHLLSFLQMTLRRDILQIGELYLLFVEMFICLVVYCLVIKGNCLFQVRFVLTNLTRCYVVWEIVNMGLVCLISVSCFRRKKCCDDIDVHEIVHLANFVASGRGNL